MISISQKTYDMIFDFFLKMFSWVCWL